MLFVGVFLKLCIVTGICGARGGLLARHLLSVRDRNVLTVAVLLRLALVWRSLDGAGHIVRSRFLRYGYRLAEVRCWMKLHIWISQESAMLLAVCLLALRLQSG